MRYGAVYRNPCPNINTHAEVVPAVVPEPERWSTVYSASRRAFDPVSRPQRQSLRASIINGWHQSANMASAIGTPFPTRKYPLEGGEVTILEIPFVSQSPPSMYCVVASMKMCWDYIRATVGPGKKPEDSPDLTFDAIRRLTRCDELTGTVLSDELTQAFNESQGLVDARLVPGVTTADMASRISRGLPVIALYYIEIARDPETEIPGVGHACVFLGSTSVRVLIHNPWLGPYTQWSARNFNWSRVPMMDYAIVFDPRLRRIAQRQIIEGGTEAPS